MRKKRKKVGMKGEKAQENAARNWKKKGKRRREEWCCHDDYKKKGLMGTRSEIH